MFFANSVYRLYEESGNGISKYFISFRDSAGVFQELEVSKAFYLEFRQMERKTRNMRQSEWRHNEHLELTEQALHRRAIVYPKSVDEQIIERLRNEQLYKAIAALPEIQRRRFILYSEYEMTYRELAEREGCSPTAIQHSLFRAKQKIRKKMEV